MGKPRDRRRLTQHSRSLRSNAIVSVPIAMVLVAAGIFYVSVSTAEVAGAQPSTWSATEALPAAAAAAGSDIFSNVLSDLVCPAAVV